ncbi:hypothetical protein RR46_00398 [Papilio xuthus]|uniref:Uncharacterized protein n=1 Tax=Papilio xuthus TaxID=66420 RepID=A0A0N1I420_PAPXU|nr:hypothetical protein RR46_00398 [Papilio xuthus]
MTYLRLASSRIKWQKDGLHEAPIYIYNLQIQIFSLALAVCSVLRHHRRGSSAGVPSRPHPPPRAPSHRDLQLRFSTPRADTSIIFVYFVHLLFLLQSSATYQPFITTYSPLAQQRLNF